MRPPLHMLPKAACRPVGSATPHSGDPSDSTAGTPGLSRCLMSSRLRHTVGLALVLSNVVVNQGDNVGPDGSPEDCGQTDGGSSWGVLVAVHPDQGPRRCKRHLGFFSCRSESPC